MNENINNPLNDFLNATEASNDLFADLPFKEVEATTPPAENSKKTENSKQEEQPTAPKQTNLFAEALAQTPSSPKEDDDPFSAALKKAQAQSDERLSNGFSEKDALFSYGKVKDEITEHEVTFEDLRQKYETDFPELSESKKVSWSVSYGKVTKAIQNPGSDKVYDIKSEIEKSKQFLDGIKKAKSDADKQPECLVKPRVIAQSKGEGLPISSYKEYCLSAEEAQASKKPIVLFPTRSGKIYEMRKTPVGVFTAPAVNLPELSESNSGFKMELPKIPMHILMTIVNFFEKLSDTHELEALFIFCMIPFITNIQ